MKRIFTILAALGFVWALAGCGTDGTANVSNGTNCPSGQERNEVTGKCQSSDGTNNNTPDGGQPGDAGADAEPPDPWDDNDGDGEPNRFDNCDNDANADQADGDGDGVGDVCDNCLESANTDQADSDGDGQGDACASGPAYDSTLDHDGDGAATISDNCPQTSNPDQADNDGDSLGNACDNCPDAANYDQVDSNSDGVGDACSPTPVGNICSTQESSFTQVEPNIYIILDKSGSMGSGSGSSMEQAKDALDVIADNLAGSVRFGLLAYPYGGNDCTAPGTEHLDMGTHTAAQIKASYAGISASGVTPTGGALYQVRTQGLYNDPSDSLDNVRPKVVVLITDGNPNDSCGNQTYAANQAGEMYNAGVPVYVIGFNSGASPANLTEMAQRGGTNSHYTADTPGQLVNVLNGISDSVISCSYVLDPQPEDPNKIWVEIQGSPVDQNASNGFTYDSASATLTLHGQACTTLRNADPNAPSPLKITLGCATECDNVSEEICDYQDNNCDGQIDEGCESCVPEVCDGLDNNCDGETDEGCPNCSFDNESCETDSDCCEGNCRDNICQPACRPLGVVCSQDSDCCEGACAANPDGTRECVGG